MNHDHDHRQPRPETHGHGEQAHDGGHARQHDANAHGHAGHTNGEPGHDEHARQHEPGGNAGHDKQAHHHAHGGHAGHDKHAGHSVEMFRAKLWISLALTIPTIAWGHMLARIVGRHEPLLPGSTWIGPIFGTAVFAYGGWVFVQGAAREIKDRMPGMMTLVALAIGVAFIFSIAVTFGYPGMPLWEELATLVTVMLLGHWIEMRSIFQAQGALQELAKLLPGTAWREIDGRTEEVPVSELRAGDRLLIRPGAAVPADAVVRSGRSSVNEAMITGESRPVDKTDGDQVIAGTVNGAGSLHVEVARTGDDTSIARIMRLVEQAQRSRSRAQALADRAAFYLTIVAVAASIVTAVAWTVVGGDSAFTVERVVSVLVVACPHALGLAIPLVIAISTTLGARTGLLVRDRRGLEEARKLNAVVFDKTGTLTLAQHRVVALQVVEGETIYVHVAENHRRDIPPSIIEAASSEFDPDRRILVMLGARGSHVAAKATGSNERSEKLTG